MKTLDFEKAYETIPGTGWLTKNEARLLWDWCNNYGTETILEVGCYYGRSTCLMAQSGRQIISVDPFKDFSSVDMSGAETLAAFMANIRDRGYGDRVSLYNTYIEKLVLPDGVNIDSAYLDGDHTYDGTINQIQKALRLGVKHIAIHDVNDTGDGLQIKKAALFLLGPWVTRVERLAIWNLEKR